MPPPRPDEWVQARAKVGLLTARYALPSGAQSSLLALLGVLHEDPHAPTTIRAPVKAADDHLADSLVALELQQVRSASVVADLGSGAGFPGLPLAIALPDAEISLVESNRRKCTFIERGVAAAGAGNATAVHVRAETWPAGIERFDLVTARAVAPLVVVAEYAAPLLAVGGSLVVWRGRRNPDEEDACSIGAAQLGLEVADPVRVHPYPGVEARFLHVMLKVRSTPARFPRRAGMAEKRPLGAGSTPMA